MAVDGFCDDRFARLRAAFAANFAERAERGGAVAIWHRGALVVDLWGGWSDVARTAPWQRDTIVNFFSVSKALCAIACMRLVDEARLDLDQPVARYWPAFAAGGKQDVTVRQMLSHQAGLPAIRKPLPDGAALDWQVVTAALAEQEPWWRPGSGHGYHVNTFGFLAGELVRRISGRSIGTLLRQDVAGPLGADVHIGLPASEHRRVSEFQWPGNPARPDIPNDDTLMRWNTYWNPPGFSGSHWVNHPRWREAEVPSTNGHGNARGIARVYAALAEGGEVDGVRILSRAALAAATTEQVNGHDIINNRPSRFGVGFQLTQPDRPLGPNPGAFGHFGAGGSLGFCDPEARLAFGYVTNDMGPRWQNPRNRALLDALYASL
ncbi:MAG TPA: serine hydrolase domain-containing protein [Rhizomicrobium sp.]|jgi:CubicO group peptidase (beta-lactamase class C family)|nr:serine hydrolase domain-containing protein [Rhizomicrobium sp.]